MSMSVVFSIMTILSSVLMANGLHTSLDSFETSKTFCNLISLLFWWPNEREDALSDVQYVYMSDKYYEDCTNLLDLFLEILQRYYSKNDMNAASIDSPNVHRLVELVTTTLPSYGHCLLFAELPFESYHQCLKSNISKNTSNKAAVTAIKSVLLTDWMRRLSTELRRVKLGNPETLTETVQQINTNLANANDGERYVGLATRLVPFGRYFTAKV